MAALDEPDAPPKRVLPCSLDKPTQGLLNLIFDNDMFQNAMKSMEIGEPSSLSVVMVPRVFHRPKECGEPSTLLCRYQEDATGKAEQTSDCQGL